MSGMRKKASKRLREAFLFVASMLFSFVFMYSANVHMSNPYSFLSHIYSYDVVSESLGVIVAAVLPSMQLVIGVAILFFPTLRSHCFLGATALLLIFTGFQLQAHFRGLNISCGCFSNSDDDPITWVTIGRTAILSAIGIASCFVIWRGRESSETSLDVKVG